MTPWIRLTIFCLAMKIGPIVKLVIELDFLFAFIGIFSWVLGVYFFLVVWSYKVEVEEGEDGGDLNYMGKVHYTKEDKELLRA